MSERPDQPVEEEMAIPEGGGEDHMDLSCQEESDAPGYVSLKSKGPGKPINIGDDEKLHSFSHGIQAISARSLSVRDHDQISDFQAEFKDQSAEFLDKSTGQSAHYNITKSIVERNEDMNERPEQSVEEEMAIPEGDATHGSSQDYDENAVGVPKPDLPTVCKSKHSAKAQVNEDLNNGEEPGMVVTSLSSRQNTHGSSEKDATPGPSRDYDENAVGETKPDLQTGFQSVHTAEAQVNEKNKKDVDFVKNIDNYTHYKVFAFVEHLKPPKFPAISNCRKRSRCPFESFVARVEKEYTKSIIRDILQTLQGKYPDLSEKKDTLRVVLCVCLIGSKLHVSPLAVAETLLIKPSHLKSWDTTVTTNLREAPSDIDGLGLTCLDEGKCVTDEVIDAFFKPLENDNQKTNVRVLPTDFARIWLQGETKRDLVEVHKYEKILIPILDEEHWILMVIFPQKRVVKVYDSLGRDNRKYYQQWIKFIKEQNKVSGEKLEEWSYRDGNSSPQYDNVSCGVFVMMNGEAEIKEVPPQIMRQVHCRMYREYVKKYIESAGTPMSWPERLGVILREENDGPDDLIIRQLAALP